MTDNNDAKALENSNEIYDGKVSNSGEFFIVKAEENGVMVIGLTRGKETRFHHNEKLDKGEVMIFQFTEHTSAMKIRGKASIYSRHGLVESGK
ncbi:MAG: trp RNA-binding attenuation protein MtrB [Clostridiales bacterium]